MHVKDRFTYTNRLEDSFFLAHEGAYVIALELIPHIQETKLYYPSFRLSDLEV